MDIYPDEKFLIFSVNKNALTLTLPTYYSLLNIKVLYLCILIYYVVVNHFGYVHSNNSKNKGGIIIRLDNGYIKKRQLQTSY